MLVSRDTLQQVALAIRSHITPMIVEKGYVTDDEVRTLIKRHAGRQIASPRSIGIVQEELCDA